MKPNKKPIMRQAIIDRLNERLSWVYEVDEIKPVFTPFEPLGKEIVEKLPSTQGSILVLADCGLLVALLLNNRKADITFVAHTERQAEFARQVSVTKIVHVGYNDPIKELELQLMGQKFDIVVGNPPYRAGLHLDFLRLSFATLKPEGELIFVHPAEWLVQKRKSKKSAKYKEIRDHLDSTCKTDITFIDNPWPNVGLYVPLTVTHVKPGSGVTFEDARTVGYGAMKLTPRARVPVNSLSEVTQFGDPSHVASFLKKIASHQERWDGHEKVWVGDWYVNLSGITGNGKTSIRFYDDVTRTIFNMYSVVNSTSLEVTTVPAIARPQGGKEVGNEKLWFSFATEQEAKNALSFVMRSKVFRALLVLVKIDQNVQSGRVFYEFPWLDWKQEWTDEKLASFFKLTSDELQTINDIVDTVTLK